jgi:hypothetical protein
MSPLCRSSNTHLAFVKHAIYNYPKSLFKMNLTSTSSSILEIVSRIEIHLSDRLYDTFLLRVVKGNMVFSKKLSFPYRTNPGF